MSKSRSVYDSEYLDQQLLRDCAGISVFRRLSGPAVTPLLDIFNNATRGLPVISRASGTEKEHFLTLVQMLEFQKNREYLGSLCIRNVMDAIYNEVPSLRKKVSVKINEDHPVKIFNSRNSIQRSISVLLDPESEAFLKAERREVLSVIEDLTCFDNKDFDWLLDPTPHVSLGKILVKEVSPERVKGVVRDIESNLPEEFTLNMATIHKGRTN